MRWEMREMGKGRRGAGGSEVVEVGIVGDHGGLRSMDVN